MKKTLVVLSALCCAALFAASPKADWETTRYRGFTTDGASWNNGPNIRKNLRDAAKLNANIVRLQMQRCIVIRPDGSFEFRIPQILAALDEARDQKQVLVLGLQGVMDLRKRKEDHTGRKIGFWDDETYLRAIKSFWNTMAYYCKDRNQAIWYDIWNEPLDWKDMPSFPKKWPNWAQQIIDLIRAIDKKHEIVVEVGPGGLGWGFKTFPLLKGTGIIYSVHNYQPHQYTHQGLRHLKGTDLRKAYLKMNLSWPGVYSDSEGGMWDAKRLEIELKPVRDFQLKHKVRIYVGEFGVIRWAPNNQQYLKDNLELFEKWGWDYTYHAFRESSYWSFEHTPTFPDCKPSAKPSPAGKVLLDYLKRNKK